MRYIDDQAGQRLAALFDEDGVLQLAGTVFEGRDAIGKMFRAPEPPHWTEAGELLKQPGRRASRLQPDHRRRRRHRHGRDRLLVLERDEDGRARITLVARYRDRFRRNDDGRWVITNRTGVSIARPGEAGTDAEWARALARMPDGTRAKFRTE